MSYLQLGYGKMGAALLDRWASELDAVFTVIDPSAQAVRDPIVHERNVSEINGHFDIVIVAVKPHLVGEALAPVLAHLTNDALVISVAAGVPISTLERLSGGRPVIRLMPNLPVVLGRGMSGLFAGHGVSDAQKERAAQLATIAGDFVWLEGEDQLDRFTAVAGSGPGYIFELARSYVDAAVALGFSPQEARKIVLTTIVGTAEMALASDQSLEELRNAVTSKKGTTEAGLNVLRADKIVEKLLHDVVEAAYGRAIELRA